jgi:pilus assembly protein Flp/PilA
VIARPGRRDGGCADPTAGLGEAHQHADSGATATEYAVLMAFIAIVVAVGIGVFGGKLNDFFDAISTAVDGYL